MAQFSFTPEQRVAFREALAHTVFIQEGMRTSTGAMPGFASLRERAVNGLANQMLTFTENMIREADRNG